MVIQITKDCLASECFDAHNRRLPCKEACYWGAIIWCGCGKPVIDTSICTECKVCMQACEVEGAIVDTSKENK